MDRPLVLQDVTKRYGQGPPVIDGLSHTFAPGTATGLVGPNGSGKTTLMRLLSATAFPTAGQVRYGDLDVHARPHAYLRHVGLVHASAALPQYLDAEEILAWVLRERDAWDDDGGPARIDALLTRLRLDERRANLVGTYSSGMAKKVQIAAALVHEPRVLLMDEPFRSLDTASTEATQDLLREFLEGGGLLVVASHLGPSLQALADDTLHLGTVPAGASP